MTHAVPTRSSRLCFAAFACLHHLSLTCYIPSVDPFDSDQLQTYPGTCLFSMSASFADLSTWQPELLYLADSASPAAASVVHWTDLATPLDPFAACRAKRSILSSMLQTDCTSGSLSYCHDMGSKSHKHEWLTEMANRMRCCWMCLLLCVHVWWCA